MFVAIVVPWKTWSSDEGSAPACVGELLDALDRCPATGRRGSWELVDEDHARLVVDVDQIREGAADVDADALHEAPPAVRTILPKNSLLSMSSIAFAASSRGNVAASGGLHGAARDQREAGLDLVAVVHERPDHGELRRKNGMMSNGTTSPECAPQIDEPSVLRERVEPVLEGLAADVLVDDVDAVTVRDAHHLGDDVLRGVVDAHVQPELAAFASLSSRLEVPITNAPACLATWTAADPIPLPTELTSTVSPARTSLASRACARRFRRRCWRRRASTSVTPSESG